MTSIHPTAWIEDGAVIGAGTAVWDHVHVRTGARIGRGCIVGEKTYVAPGVVVGDLVKINACVYLCTGVEVGDGAMLAAHVVFTNDRRPRATDPDVTALLSSAPGPHTERTRVGRGATIGANATIGPGVTIGDYAMVGMGAVVTDDVPAHGLVVGNPARLIGLVARDGTPVLRLHPGENLPERARIACPGDGFLVVEGATVRWEGGPGAREPGS
ncbi:MAG TPA: acyltransferase [Planctomycetota bacterium]|nr:acyltransferase [Planctomycetota bacterium]